MLVQNFLCTEIEIKFHLVFFLLNLLIKISYHQAKLDQSWIRASMSIRTKQTHPRYQTNSNPATYRLVYKYSQIRVRQPTKYVLSYIYMGEIYEDIYGTHQKIKWLLLVLIGLL